MYQLILNFNHKSYYACVYYGFYPNNEKYNLFNIYNSLDRKLRRAYLIMFCLYESAVLSLIVEEPEDRVPEDLGVNVDVVLPVLQIQ
jgi:hypothetical protein